MVAVYSFDGFTRGPVLPVPGIPADIAATSVIATEFATLTQDAAEAWYTAVTKGIGEVMFADSVIVGILFLIGIAITSLRGASMALAGAIVGVVLPICLGADKTLIEMGLYAFNPVLTMMAVGWVFLKPTTGTAILALLAGMLTVICQAGLANFLAPIGLPTLTFPFVLVMWMFLFAASKSKHWGNSN